jgi:predicted RNase H-like nuclease
MPNHVTTFAGLDMAWKIDGNHSGIALLTGDASKVELTALSNGLTTQAGIAEFLRTNCARDAVLAIDASLIVKNRTGQRPCETEISRVFGVNHAAAHTSNLSRPHCLTGMALVSALEPLGFIHDFTIAAAEHRAGRWIFELYPHPAMVRLFGLERIIQYKKGRVDDKRAGLATLRAYLAALPGLIDNALLRELLVRDLQALRGVVLKRYEDLLDALFCAYLAWHCWRWGSERNEMFGTLEEGYIVVPKGSV